MHFNLLSGVAQVVEPPPPASILQDLRNFDTMGSVLYIAAHPDDEDTQLITFLARGRHYRSAYLSVNRGDGGQNVLGPEFGAELGVIRTEELLAARRLDGGEQFFTRAIDFGYSKDYRETLRIWDHQQVLADVVRIIRTFQPDSSSPVFPRTRRRASTAIMSLPPSSPVRRSKSPAIRKRFPISSTI